jgi:DNA repair exonuclease SbcCD ATPase subunit
LTQEIEEHNNNITNCQSLEKDLTEKLDTAKKDIEKLTIEKEDYINRKEKIDVSITELNPANLEKDIETLTSKGVEYKTANDTINKRIDEIGVVDFDEDRHDDLTKSLNLSNTNKALKEAEVKRLEKVIEDLIAGGICQSCNRKLDDVDNTEHIESHKSEISKINSELKLIDKEITSVSKTIEELNTKKVLIDEKNKLELSRDKNEVEMSSLRNKIKEKNNDLKKYNLNLKAIELNKNIDIEITNIKTKLQVLEYSKDDLITKIERVQNDEKNNSSEIVTKEKLIEIIKKEEGVEKIFKLYIELVGKKGISKLVLRSVLPIINSEAQRLLEDVCDFEIEIFMDDKNDVQFLIIKDGVTKLLKSGSGFERTAASLVLRCVLGKISTLPMPNFIAFDEVLGKVAPDNMEKLKTLFDKIKEMYEIVFLITHNELVKDWSDNIITVVKENNISKAVFN